MKEKGKGRSYRTSSWLKVDVKIPPCPKSIAYNRLVIFLCQKPMTCNRSIMVIGGVLRRGGRRKVNKPTTIAQHKMEDDCILCNVIETF